MSGSKKKEEDNKTPGEMIKKESYLQKGRGSVEKRRKTTLPRYPRLQPMCWRGV